MKIKLSYKECEYASDLSRGIDISLPLKSGAQGPKCFYAPDFETTPFRSGDFIGAVAEGAPVNFMNVTINPHGNGTHTECMGHISDKGYTINKSLKEFHHVGRLISIHPEQLDNGDFIIHASQLRHLRNEQLPPVLIIRTLPNSSDKRRMDYSGKNPCYFHTDAIQFMVDHGVEHLMIDLPSVDREEDDGQLAAHKVFWNYPHEDRLHCTITEMIYVDFDITDGMYLVNIMIPSFEMDAAPSKIVLYKLEKIKS